MKLIFDFDGTIHKTELIYKEALNTSLKELGKDIENINFKSIIGNKPATIWKSFGLSDEETAYFVKKTGAMMDQNMQDFGKLYEGSYETLEYLKEKYELIICSNCRNDYMKSARRAYDLDKYFSTFITGEDHDYIDKYKILRNLDLGPYIFIGDRENDIEAGFKNNMKTIFAKYGYGSSEEGKNADISIDDVRQLKDIL